MGKHANSAAYREYERQQSRKADESFEPVEPLTEMQRAAEWDDTYFDRLDAEASGRRIGEWHGR